MPPGVISSQSLRVGAGLSGQNQFEGIVQHGTGGVSVFKEDSQHLAS